jgi:hypothetical protein
MNGSTPNSQSVGKFPAAAAAAAAALSTASMLLTSSISKEAAILRGVVGSSLSSLFFSLAILISMSMFTAASAGASAAALLPVLALVTAYGATTHLCFELHNQVRTMQTDGHPAASCLFNKQPAVPSGLAQVLPLAHRSIMAQNGFQRLKHCAFSLHRPLPVAVAQPGEGDAD